MRLVHYLKPRLRVFREALRVDEKTPGLKLAAPDAAPELMERREPKTLRVLDDHAGRVRDVDADLDDARRDEHLDGAGAKIGHDAPLLVLRDL